MCGIFTAILTAILTQHLLIKDQTAGSAFQGTVPFEENNSVYFQPILVNET